jgi:PAS domain S-box-containing protein
MRRSHETESAQISRMQRYGLIMAVIWTLLIGYILFLNYRDHQEEALALGKMQSQAFFEKDVLYRRWASRHGGVYVPVTETTRPNPYLAHIPERDLITPSGRQLTLMNPAYMTRQVFEMAQEYKGTGRGHITSLNPIRPGNEPDAWEKKAMANFELGAKEFSQIDTIDGKPYYRYMKPLIADKPCLKCHAAQGYQEGDLRGGLSVSVPLEPIYTMMAEVMQDVYLTHALIWLLGLGGIGFGTRRLKQITADLVAKSTDLEQQAAERQKAQNTLQEQAVILEAEVEAHKHAEAELRATRAILQAAMDQSPAGIVIAEVPDGKLQYVNNAALRISGKSSEEVVADDIGSYVASWQFFHPDGTPFKEDEVPLTRAILYGETYSREFILRTKSGDRLVWANAAPILDEAGTATAAIAVFLDITEQKALEEQLRQSQKMEAVGQLAGGVAHDFNNILSVIMGYGSMLKMGTGLDQKQQEKLDQIISAAEKAAQLTGGLLAFSRKQVLAPKTVNLNDIIQHLQQFLTRVIGEDIHLKTILNDADLPVSIDSSQIEQALINLATNARDAMPHGGQLTIETGQQLVDASFTHAHGYGQPGSYAVITVTDSGGGMDAETRKKIFEPFFTTKEPGKGTGLGMAIVYGIVKQHNGFINLYSEPGKGTTFRIYLPLASSATITAEKQAAPAPPAGGSETILVAEDEPMVSQLVAGILTEYGYEVILAGDGKEVVAQFIANRDKVKLTLMDMIMPKQSGMAAAEEIRQLQPATKILFSSGYTADFIRNRGMDDDGVELIMKPFQPLELLRKVREMLDRH